MRYLDIRLLLIITCLLFIDNIVLFAQKDKIGFNDINNKVFITYNSESLCGNICRLEFFNDSLFHYGTYNVGTEDTILSDEYIIHKRSYESIGKWVASGDSIILNTIYPSETSILQIMSTHLRFENKTFIYQDNSLIDTGILDTLHLDSKAKLLGEKAMKSAFEIDNYLHE